MATLKEVRALAVRDAAFRKNLIEDVEGTLRARRLELSDAELTSLKNDVRKLASKSIRELDVLFKENPLGW